jgi:hypothetical protein
MLPKKIIIINVTEATGVAAVVYLWQSTNVLQNDIIKRGTYRAVARNQVKKVVQTLM